MALSSFGSVVLDTKIETVWMIEEMSVAAEWFAKGEMTKWILWWARSMLLVGVGCLFLCVTSKQTVSPRTVATDNVCLSQFDERHHRDRNVTD